MQQATFSVTESQIEFIKQYSRFGFKDKSSMVSAALDELRKKFEYQNLIESADLYAEIYKKNDDIQELTNSAVLDWPE